MDAALSEVIAAARDETNTPGCAVAFAHGDRTWAGGFGLANVETGLPFTPETRIPIGSMTKPYTATLLLALVEAGRVDLDTPIRNYLPEFRVLDDDAGARATVRQLLNHTTGWVGDLVDESGDDPHDLDRGAGAIAGQVARMASFRQIAPVGAFWAYSNSAYVVAGRIAEALCGQPYETLLERIILTPLGMTQSTPVPERAMSHPLAVGHTAVDGGFEVNHAPWAPFRRVAPAGAVVSTALDQLRWHRWWLGHELDGVREAPLSATTRARAIDENVPGGTACDAMGLGWMIDDLEGGLVVHHGGTWAGFQTMGLFVPSADIALVVLANARSGVRLAYRIREHVLERFTTLRERDRRPIDVDADRLAEYAGSYRGLHATDPARDATLDVRVAGSALRVLEPTAKGGEAPAPSHVRLFRSDEAIVVDGPLEGLRAEFLRGDGGALRGLRFAGRVWIRDDANQEATAGSATRGASRPMLSAVTKAPSRTK